MFAIETENLYKSFDGFAVLRGLDLRVPEGRVYGILGPNGAGKSTLLHLLLGFLKPTKGSLRVLGEQDIESIRGRVGYLPERLRYHLRFTGREGHAGERSRGGEGVTQGLSRASTLRHHGLAWGPDR